MLIRLASGTFVALLLCSCSLLRGNKFEVNNATGHELTDMQVYFADYVARRESLGPGETFSFRPSPSRDGGISVSYMENGEMVKHELGYVAPPFAMRCEFQITSGDVRGECE